MKDQEIIDNAPPNTSIVDSKFKFFDDIYCELNEQGEWNWKNTMPEYPIRSLADVNRIVELEKGIEKLSIAVSEAFPSLLSCDNVLIVPVPAYNKIVEEFNALKEPKT
ncbi:MAG: hypothetical protein ACJASL_000147 [Paraglaciecola sp.]|jgi:hypothetical protein